MTAALLAPACALAVLAAAALHRPPPRRVRNVRQRPARPTHPPRQPTAATRLVPALAAVAALTAVSPVLALAAVAAWWARPRWQARAATRRRQQAIAADLPEVVDLLRLAVGSGLTVPLAVQAVARRADGPVGRALAQTTTAAQSRGTRLADALDDLPATLGEQARPLAATLAGSERYGHAIGPALERLAAEGRDDQRRQAEAAARRVPVLLLFPLVLCVLPAFALLTVAPLIAGALRALRL